MAGPMSGERTIRGETVMRWEDQARYALRPILRAMAVFSVAMAAVLLLVWSTTSSDDDWLLLRHAPLAALMLVARDSWPFFTSGFALVLVLVLATQFWSFYRLADVNRRLSYEVTAQGITTRDAADFALSVPWSSVVEVRNSDHVMRVRLAAGGWRTVFWRAFAPEDRDQILSWAMRAGKPTISLAPGAAREL